MNYQHYEVSSEGEVRNSVSGKTVKQRKNAQGYHRVDLLRKVEGKFVKSSQYVHRLVAFAFLPKPEGDVEVHHKDEVRGNNTVGNLEWITHAENMAHVFGRYEDEWAPLDECPF